MDNPFSSTPPTIANVEPQIPPTIPTEIVQIPQPVEQVQLPQPQQTIVPTQQITPTPTPTTNQTPPVNPIITKSPQPQLEPGQNLICQLNPGMFDAFIKVISLLDDKNIINITESQICQTINNGTAILLADISSLVGNIRINLHILQPKKYLKLFKALKGNDDVFIIDDPTRSQFIVQSGVTKIWLPKQIEQLEPQASLPDFSQINRVGIPIKIEKDERNKITTFMSDQTNVILLVHQNQLKGFSIPETTEATFNQFVSVPVKESEAEIKLVSNAFLCIPSDSETTLNLGFLGSQYWLSSAINTALNTIYIYEALSPMQEDKILI